jgi:hypothetical protein
MLSDTEIVDLCSCPDCVRVRTDLMALIERYRGALENIVGIGGNLPDERLATRTGPNDAAHRGLMYCSARQFAHAALFPDPAAEEGKP